MKRLLTTAGAALAATPALAHHPLGGTEMTTFAHGLLSGVGHPVLGFDHLFFVALVGIVAAFAGRAFTGPLAYLAAMLAGVLLTTFGPALPLTEAVIAVSLLGLGAVALSGRAPSAPVAMALFAGFGLFHGAAFGGAMASAEAGAMGAVLPGYLLGLLAVQYAIAVGAGLALRRLASAAAATALEPRLAGAVVAGVGLFLTLETAEGAIFGALGWG
ncbi:urease accessory protein [Palleronia aestuarii]|uniref:Urease accessory protein n=1 Tax=Palleronia aestuarii TaxID=568105 RepID=A0A2W7P6R0_9RHOB|nr:HupE/UreJ family protein [Palleronia aestuarii]PZX19082.1 urease accessory protein [Palleronia aestuarii]